MQLADPSQEKVSGTISSVHLQPINAKPLAGLP
jgi:hypothetical protein